jgi:ribonuclease PH
MWLFRHPHVSAPLFLDGHECRDQALMKEMSLRPSGRRPDQLREISLDPGFAPHAEGSCLIRCGNTHVLCTASVQERVPPFLRNTGRGWVTAEYGMLPRSTDRRTDREAARGKQSGRTQEIQRLIGRSLRAVIDLESFGERQIILDCDVLRADGGTRCASITGAYVALHQALQWLVKNEEIPAMPRIEPVAAVSCGIFNGEAVLDLDYPEDSGAEADANFVMTRSGGIVEIQVTAEEDPLSADDFGKMQSLARAGIEELARLQEQSLAATAE